MSLRKSIQSRLPVEWKFTAKLRLLSLATFGVQAARQLGALKQRTLGYLDRCGIEVEAARAHELPTSAFDYSVSDFLLLTDAATSENRYLPRGAIRSSIIIPVFNNAELTFRCVRSLLREVDLNATEIIVINNASQDETRLLLSRLSGLLRVIDNAANRGFVEACNQGAAVARGEYLVFLNNDTIVLPGWLKYLEETARRDASVGAVGSVLLRPDGRIQEAGGGIWQDGTGFHYGWGEHPDSAKYNFAREVDYCSGASLLVRREAFERLGGFDSRYAPAYYEDTDLCFGLRTLNLKVIYQPRSRLIHYEGATAGTDVTTGTKRYQEINRAKFVRKWREILEQHHFAPSRQRIELAANRKRGTRFLVFDDATPMPDRDSGSQRMMHLLRLLAELGHIVFVPATRTAPREYEAALGEIGIEVAHLADAPRLIKDGGFDAIILSRPQVAERLLSFVRRSNRKVKIIYDTVDVSFLRLAREHQTTGGTWFAPEAERFRKLERRFADASDQVWCITDADQSALAREAPHAHIRLVPNIHELQLRGLKFTDRSDLLFIGGFRHRPNLDAINYFVREIFPLVREALPDVKLHLVGGDVPEELAAYAADESNGVVALGRVSDVDGLFYSCRVLVAPLRYGAGMKGKVGQALAYGLPVVTTFIGAEGMSLQAGTEVMIADDPRLFASAVVELYRDEKVWQRLSDGGYDYIKRTLTPQRVRELIHSHLAELGVTHRNAALPSSSSMTNTQQHAASPVR